MQLGGVAESKVWYDLFTTFNQNSFCDVSASESSWLCTTRRRWSEPLCEDKQLAVQDPCVRISRAIRATWAATSSPFFFHTITPTSNFFYTRPPLSSNIQFLNVIFPFILTTWSVSRFYLENGDSNVIQLLLESFSFRNAVKIQPYCW